MRLETFCVETGKVQRDFKYFPMLIFDMAFSPNGQYLACAAAPDRIDIFNFDTTARQQTLKVRDPRKLTFGENGSILVNNRGRITLDWSLPERSELHANWQGY
jgi:uncharacterized protein with WD repeat